MKLGVGLLHVAEGEAPGALPEASSGERWGGSQIRSW